METTIAAKRKLIDISPSVFETLSIKAKGKRMSLKRYIESLLEEDARNEDRVEIQGVSDPRILGLIGSARHRVGYSADEEDERLQYILSK